MKYVITFEDREVEVDIHPRDDGRFDVDIEGVSRIADLRRAGGRSLYSMILGTDAYEASVVRLDEQTRVTLRGRDLMLRVESQQERDARLVDAAGGAKGPQTVKSVMPGIVLSLIHI